MAHRILTSLTRSTRITCGTSRLARGKKFFFGANRLTDELIGGWQSTGIVRWTTGFPFTMDNGAYYPTNWDIRGLGQLVSKIPSRAAARGSPDSALCRSGRRLRELRSCAARRKRHTEPVARRWILCWDRASTRLSAARTGQSSVALGDVQRHEQRTLRPALDRSTLDNSANFGQATALLTNKRLAQFAGRIEF